MMKQYVARLPYLEVEVTGGPDLLVPGPRPPPGHGGRVLSVEDEADLHHVVLHVDRVPPPVPEVPELPQPQARVVSNQVSISGVCCSPLVHQASAPAEEAESALGGPGLAGVDHAPGLAPSLKLELEEHVRAVSGLLIGQRGQVDSVTNQRPGECVAHAAQGAQGEPALLGVQGSPRVPEVEAGHGEAVHVLQEASVVTPGLRGCVTVTAEVGVYT